MGRLWPCFDGFAMGHGFPMAWRGKLGLSQAFGHPTARLEYRASTFLMKRKLYCTFPQALIKEPLLFALANTFQVVPNIRGATVTEEIAILSLEIEGTQENVEKATAYLIEKGVNVDELSD